MQEPFNYQELLSKITQNAFRLNAVKNDESRLFNEIHSLPKEQYEFVLKNAKLDMVNQPVNSVRNLMANALLKGQKVDLRLLEQFKTEVEGHYKKDNPFKNYQQPFSILFPFFIQNNRKTEREFFAKLEVDLKQGLHLTEKEVKVKTVDFYGARNFGDDRIWIALYNKSHKNQTTAKQIFVEISIQGIRVGVYNRPEGEFFGENWLKPDEFNMKDIVGFFSKFRDLILNDIATENKEEAKVEEEVIEKKGGGSKKEVKNLGFTLYKISLAPNDFTDEYYTSLLNRRVVTTIDGVRRKVALPHINSEELKNAKPGDAFYLCKGRDKIECVGKLVEKIQPEKVSGVNQPMPAWKYDLYAFAKDNDGYKKATIKNWLPKKNTDVRIVPPTELDDVNEEIFIPYFDLPIEDILKGEVIPVEEIEVFNVRSTIAPLSSDSVDGKDHFGIDKDVQAFAKIIAADSFKPPLAIALFGKWGTGKSFFMKKLWKKVNKLAEEEKKNLEEHKGEEPYEINYCTGVAQIHFNAWSYLDANLWASMVSKIFDGLQHYIDGDTEAKKEKRVIEKEFREQLNLIKEERQHFEDKIEAASAKIDDLIEYKEQLQKNLDTQISTIEKASLKELIQQVDSEYEVSKEITKAFSENKSITYTKEQIEEIIPKEYLQKPELALEQINKTSTFVREFFRKKNIGWNLFALLVVLLIIGGLPMLLPEATDKIKNALLIPQAIASGIAVMVPVWKRYKTIFDKFKPIVTSLWKVKETYDKKVKEAVFAHEQQMESIKLAIKNTKDEIELVNSEILKADQNIEKMEYQLEHSLASNTMYSFIEKRAKGDMYKKHLGIISTIRRDFEVLSELFVESLEEEKQEQYKSIGGGKKREDFEDPNDFKSYQSFQKRVRFRENFNNPLQRIVLYIDDLDRCSEERVVEVLEAVNLLMAFPLFVVVVGVDQRWIKNALIKKYRLQFTGAFNGSAEGNDEELGLEQIDAINYLEKIFQVPFHLKRASDNGVKTMLENLSSILDAKPDSEGMEDKRKEGGTGEGEGKEGGGAIPENHEGEDDDLPKIEEGTTDDGEATTEVDKEDKKGTEKQDVEEEAQKEHLALTKEEVDLMKSMSSIIGNNPRAIKRFVNVYQILRAHAGLTLEGDKEKEEYLCLMFLLALPMGPYQDFYDEFMEYIYLSENQGNKLGQFLDTVMNLKNRKQRGKLQLGGDDKFDEAQEVLSEVSIKSLNRHSKFVRRFTFAEIHV